ncbi:sigma-70 factor domain-containing protein [Synechococcus sp. CBW1002]|uniref:sigma-70 factor domain-containing protein n=1 Tax=Synechococcus sp. CBW1002 TaxID=1353134 RepID=UPI00272DBE65|nr:sigma-70 factor domain-containing protein [Synechococcus sp. CBW1002]
MGPVQKSQTTSGPPSPKPSSGSRRGSTDLVRLYLQDIGRVDLLSHEEELTLARQVQRRERLLRERKRLAATAAELADLIALEDDRQRLASQLGHWPAVQQWAEHQGCTVPELREWRSAAATNQPRWCGGPSTGGARRGQARRSAPGLSDRSPQFTVTRPVARSK